MSSPTLPSMLLVDDEQLFVKAACKLLTHAGFTTTGCHSLADARKMLDALQYDMIVLDVHLPDGSGLELLEELAEKKQAPPVLVLTAFGDIDDAVAAMKLGAVDYLQKPCDIERIGELARKLTECDRRKARSTPAATTTGDINELIGDSEAIRNLREQLQRIGTMSSRSTLPPPTVLLVGETGVGKGLVARRLHAGSVRSHGPFIHVDCAALPRELIESELFGHRKGAFTSAHRNKAGLIEQATGGTLFLDEIGELPQDLQAKLLAVLDRRRARPVGGTDEFVTDAWFVTATHRDLASLSAEGEFRHDLYYRLSPLTINLPALREHRSDIPALARHFLTRFLDQYNLQVDFSPATERRLAEHNWPGNVRELISVVERALFASHGETIEPNHLGLEDRDATMGLQPLANAPALRQAEQEMIHRTLQETKGNVSEAARRLGMTRMMLRYRIQKFGLTIKFGEDDVH